MIWSDFYPMIWQKCFECGIRWATGGSSQYDGHMAYTVVGETVATLSARTTIGAFCTFGAFWLTIDALETRPPYFDQL